MTLRCAFTLLIFLNPQSRGVKSNRHSPDAGISVPQSLASMDVAVVPAAGLSRKLRMMDAMLTRKVADAKLIHQPFVRTLKVADSESKECALTFVQGMGGFHLRKG